MKKIAIILLLTSFTIPSMAQSPVSLGLKGGYSSSKLTTDFDTFDEESIDNYHLGAFARVSLGNIYVQPEAYFNSKGGELEEGANVVNSFDLKTVDVPVLLGVYIIKKGPLAVRANAGPAFSFIVDKDVNAEGFDNFDKDDLKDSFFGWHYGLGADFLMFTLDVRMENSSGDLYSGPNFNSDVQSKAFIVSLGIKLL